MKFTFKTIRPTGPYKSFEHEIHEIKLKRKVVGSIFSVEPYQVSFMVIKKDINEDKNPNCIWKWIRLQKTYTSIEEAKITINNHIDAILKKYNLYMMED